MQTSYINHLQDETWLLLRSNAPRSTTHERLIEQAGIVTSDLAPEYANFSCSVFIFQIKMDIHETLASLEILMSEFFAVSTSNLRKREIETMLENFSNRHDAWKHCLLFLQKSHNQYVLMFSLTTLELLQCGGRRALLGLVLAQAASEELGAARDTGVLLLSSRRIDLERLMLKGMPQLLGALSAILEKNAHKEGQSNPPPSPTSGVPATSAIPDLLANAHDIKTLDK
ncbi:Exportin-6-B [Eumeta japonica]|uniref:Exportin-6-B n=1 Tax=Eumeta variegata TaxID=151549 RepID=A0A4C1X8A6_EUMVA|nr:Exportin-6-B [Eumeta japonica]